MIKTVEQVLAKRIKDEISYFRRVDLDNVAHYSRDFVKHQMKDLEHSKDIFNIAFSKADCCEKFRAFSMYWIFDLMYEYYALMHYFLDTFESYKVEFREKNPDMVVPKIYKDIDFFWDDYTPIEMKLKTLYEQLDINKLSLTSKLLEYECVIDEHFKEMVQEFWDKK